MQIILASQNKNKLKELSTVFQKKLSQSQKKMLLKQL